MKDLIAIVIIGIAICAAYGTGLLWYHRADLLEMHLTNKRHKSYRYPDKVDPYDIRYVEGNAPKVNQTDYSPCFRMPE